MIKRSSVYAVVVLASGFGLVGCGFFDSQDDGADFDSDSNDEFGDGDSSDDGTEEPPSRGFRVFPQWMLFDVPAIVTLGADGINVDDCPIDELEGGYLCDATALQNGATATIQVERDGFEPALRLAEVPFAQILELDVHLAVEGGPTGIWSACTPGGSAATCAEVCATTMGSCVVTSCVTMDPEEPLATHELFADAECTQWTDSVALACDAPLPGAEVGGLRCCCDL